MSEGKEVSDGGVRAAQTLQAIVYSRGSLKLLDQRKLPLESIYIDIPDANAGWDAIQDMVVRGAPAIAIAAALSLAVDVVKHKTFSNGEAAVKYINERLDYLVTSRPTAVNLADAAGKLKVVVSKAFSETQTVEHVTEAYVGASEAMLAQDEADNRAIGSFGAEFVLSNNKGEGGPGGGLQVLTHCNTGSLATAAYGTALGVVRALFEQGKLEKAFCTETRPYNQGARLTAYELVYEKIPATLIADSAAASLLASGQISAIIVGADRIAANGDTANKIGTYSLAVNARHHGVPFYVAAPLTSIDAAMPSGKHIVIEQRTPRELTHALGGQGPQVAPSGIGVWNPAFDVTPADLITAIFTDKGVITKKEGSSTFDIPAFIEERSGGRQAPEGAPGIVGEDGAASEDFQILGEAGCRAYLEENKELAERLGGSKDEWTVKEVGDGNLNFVYIVEGPAGALVLKQSIPYVRCVGPSWPMTKDRSFYEVSALKEHHRLCPQHVPEVYRQDRTLAVIVMRYLEPPHIILRKGLVSGVTYPRLAEDVSEYMARTLFFTSLLALDSSDFKAGVAKFCGNVEMCRLTEQVIFTEPYCEAENNRWTTPQLDEDARAVREDSELKLHVAGLKAKFVGLNQALIHGDLHTGSLMVTQTSTQVIDPEFAFYGPMGFDVGAFLANLWLAYFSQEGHRTAEDDRGSFRAWISETSEKTWTLFVDKFLALWKESAAGKPGDAYPPAVYNTPDVLEIVQKEYVAALFQDALGFAAAKMIRRILGIAHVEDLESIANPDLRASCERKALNFAKHLMKTRHSISSIREVISLLEDGST